jgi:hypothetical protein
MPQSLLTGQLKEKPTYSGFVVFIDHSSMGWGRGAGVIRGRSNMVGIRGGAADEKKRDNEVFEKVVSYSLCVLENRKKKPCTLLAILARAKLLKDLWRLHNSLVPTKLHSQLQRVADKDHTSTVEVSSGWMSGSWQP